jgi:hypothetical protein
MKLIKYTVIVALVVLITLYFFNPNSVAEVNKLKPINQVSFQTSSSDENPIKKTLSKPIDKPDIVFEEIIEDDILPKTNKEVDPLLDYVTAYRDWQYFANCYTDIEDFQNDREPLDTLAARFENNPREAQNEPTPQQNNLYQQHADICQTMIDDVGDGKDDYYQILSKLENRFNKIEPKTEKAKQLQHALEMVKQLRQFKNQYQNSTYPVTNLSDEQTNSINQRIENLSAQVIEIYEAAEELSEEQTLAINELSNEIEILRKDLLGNRSINKESMAQKQQQLEGYLNSIDDYLHKIQSPDAFLILTNELYNPEYFQKESTVLETMKAQTGIRDSYYIRILNRLVMPLVACSMNYPCGPEADYIMSYCLGLRDSMFNEACGKNLTDFYFNFYIGMNQMNDVDNYFNYLVNRYAN